MLPIFPQSLLAFKTIVQTFCSAKAPKTNFPVIIFSRDLQIGHVFLTAKMKPITEWAPTGNFVIGVDYVAATLDRKK